MTDKESLLLATTERKTTSIWPCEKSTLWLSARNTSFQLSQTTRSWKDST